MIRTLADVAKDDDRATHLALGIIIIALCVYSVLFATSHPSMLRLLSLGYLVGSTGVGFWLYLTNPPLYVGFAWWIWFVSPFVRRIIDYSIGSFTPPSMAFALLAPYAVTVLSIFDLPRFGKRLLKRSYAPILLCLLGIIYGFLVGLPKSGGFAAFKALLEWLCPLLLGFHILARPDLYPKFRHIFQTVFAAGVLVLGGYGIFQFFAAPPWDTLWMEGSGMLSVGLPEPMQIRVFGLLDSPGPYAMVMMAGLVLLFDARGLLAKLAAVPGYLGFLLSLVRGAWGGWVLAFGYSLLRSRGASRRRLVLALALVLAILVPLATTGEIGNRTEDRFETFSNLEEDGSLQDRQYMYQTATIEALLNPIGEGLGSTRFDSGFVTVIYQLGWLGSLLYLLGLFKLMKMIVLGGPNSEEKFVSLSAGIAVAYFTLMLMGPQTVEVKGCIFWAFSSLVIASRLYRKRDQAAASTPDSSVVTSN